MIRQNRLNRIGQTTADYHRQFWLLFWGTLIDRIGSSMVWPFITIYMRQQLGIPLTTITLMLTLNSAFNLVATFVAGPVVDRFGRKGVMVLSLAASSIRMVVMSVAGTVEIWIVVTETIPRLGAGAQTGDPVDGGYSRVLLDRPFLFFCGVYTLAGMAYSLMMVLLPVYAKENFGVPESQYGLIMATNAAMVVLFQYATTQITKRHHHLRVLAVGSAFYALGVGSVAWGWNFPTFLLSMVLLTIGEMIMIPTSTTLTANLAPPDMRGRYMSVYGLTWAAGFGFGPVIGGFLNDHLAPVTIWYGGLAMGLAAALGFLLLARTLRLRD